VVEAAAEEEGDGQAAEEVVGVAVPHVPVAGSLRQRLPHPARPHRVRLLRVQALGQVLRAQPLVLGLPVVRQARRRHKVALQVRRGHKAGQAQRRRQAPLQARRRRRVVLAPAVRRHKVLRRHSSPPEQAQMSQAAVQRLAR
jgi:hypothetical protein